MHCDRYMHCRSFKGNTLYPVAQCSQNQISSTSCWSQGHVHNQMCMQVPVVKFSEGNKIGASINSFLSQKSCKKKNRNVNPRKSINNVHVKSNVIKVLSRHDKCTEPCRVYEYFEAFRNTNDVGVQFCYDLKSICGQKYLQRSPYTRCSKSILTSCHNIENLNNLGTVHLHKKCSSIHSDVKINKHCSNRHSCTNQKAIHQVSSYDVVKYKNPSPIKCCNNDIIYTARKSNSVITGKHDHCPHHLGRPVDHCCHRKANENNCTKYYKKINDISHSDQILAIKPNRCPVYSNNCFKRNERVEPCKVVCSDIVTCHKHDDILTNRKPNKYYHQCVRKTTKPICRYLRNLKLDKHLGNAEISCATQFKPRNLKLIHHNQSYPNINRDIIKRKVLYPRICDTLIKRRHRSCCRPEKTYIHIPFKLWRCKIYLCDHLHNNKPVCITKRKKILPCRKKRICSNHRCGKCKANKRHKCMTCYFKCFFKKVKRRYKMYRKIREIRCQARRRAGYDCRQFYECVLKRRSIYPGCMHYCRIQCNHCIQMMCMTCTFLIWCPFFVALEICKLFCFCF